MNHSVSFTHFHHHHHHLSVRNLCHDHQHQQHHHHHPHHHHRYNHKIVSGASLRRHNRWSSSLAAATTSYPLPLKMISTGFDHKWRSLSKSFSLQFDGRLVPITQHASCLQVNIEQANQRFCQTIKSSQDHNFLPTVIFSANWSNTSFKSNGRACDKSNTLTVCLWPHSCPVEIVNKQTSELSYSCQYWWSSDTELSNWCFFPQIRSIILLSHLSDQLS